MRSYAVPLSADFDVTIEYTLTNPRGSARFVDADPLRPDDAGGGGAQHGRFFCAGTHPYMASLSMSGGCGARCWFPCLDTMASRSEYEIRASAASRHVPVGEMCWVVASGQLESWAPADGRFQFVYKSTTPLRPSSIAVLAGQFVNAGKEPAALTQLKAAFAGQRPRAASGAASEGTPLLGGAQTPFLGGFGGMTPMAGPYGTPALSSGGRTPLALCWGVDPRILPRLRTAARTRDDPIWIMNKCPRQFLDAVTASTREVGELRPWIASAFRDMEDQLGVTYPYSIYHQVGRLGFGGARARPPRSLAYVAHAFTHAHIHAAPRPLSCIRTRRRAHARTHAHTRTHTHMHTHTTHTHTHAHTHTHTTHTPHTHTQTTHTHTNHTHTHTRMRARAQTHPNNDVRARARVHSRIRAGVCRERPLAVRAIRGRVHHLDGGAAHDEPGPARARVDAIDVI